MQHKIRSVRTEATQSKHHAADVTETSEADIQDDIEFALIQMKAETLNKIGAALTRLAEGTYGYCYECGDEIAERRLRALPFGRAVQALRRGVRDGAEPRARARVPQQGRRAVQHGFQLVH